MKLSTLGLWSLAVAALPVQGGILGKPNIVLILADDLGVGDVQCCFKDGKIPTPHLDRLAAQGTIFTDAHSGSAVCTPTRYGIMTGRYAWRTYLRSSVLAAYDDPLIEAGRLTLPAMLRQQGYATDAVGKWHLGWDWPFRTEEMRRKFGQGHKGVVPQYAEPQDFDWSQPIANGPVTRGFDTYFGTHVPNQPPYCFIENDRVVGTPSEMLRKGGVPGPMVPGHKSMDILPAITRRATEVIAKRTAEKRPFFLYFALTSPHEPVAPAKDWQGRSGISPLADFIMQTDDTVGQVMQALERNGAAGNTLVIFTADNGASYYTGLKDHLKAGHNPSGPYRGYKADIWEGGHRVPFIARWPGRIQPGSRCRNTVCLTDLMATCAAIIGSQLPGDAGVDSVSFLPNLRNADFAQPREATVHQAANGTLSLRRNKWKLIVPAQLYDLEADIEEQRNVASDHPEIVRELTALLQQCIANGRSTPGPVQPNDVPVSLVRASAKP